MLNLQESDTTKMDRLKQSFDKLNPSKDGPLMPNAPSFDEPCPENVTMFEAFEWYCPSDAKHWRRLQSAIPSLAAIGIDNMWIPPGCKAGWHGSNGYDVYDLYDLGEFKQKDSTATKWGSKEELLEMAQAARKHGIGLYWDAIFNHKAAGDYSEPVAAVRIDPKGMFAAHRKKEIGKPGEIDAWTGFQFPGRQGKYSPFRWNWSHFNGTDYNHNTKESGIWKFTGPGKKGWAKDVFQEPGLGNYDFLMFCNIDHTNPEVRDELCRWGEWIGTEIPLAGIRLDAIKHFSENFLRHWIQYMDRTVGHKWFLVGEYWWADVKVLRDVVDRFGGRISLMDVALVENFSLMSIATRGDLRDVLKDTLATQRPRNAVTFVQNHDTQDRQALETPVREWFIPHAYSLLLLHHSLGYPCVFYGDLYGTCGPDKYSPPVMGGKLPRLILARKLYAYGRQYDFFDERDLVGFTRQGHPAHSGGAGLAIVLSARWNYAWKRMFVGRHHAGERWTDILGWAWGEVLIDQKGFGVFPVGCRSCGVWGNREAEGREYLDGFIFDDDIYKDDRPGRKHALNGHTE